MTSSGFAGRFRSAVSPNALRLLLFSAFVLTPALAATQAADPPLWTDEVPAHVAIVDGAATLERDATIEPAVQNMPLLAGDRLKTTRGRVEVMFGDGSALDLDEWSTVDLLSDSLMRVSSGRVRLSVARGDGPVDYSIDAGFARASIRAAGDYRLTLSDPTSPDPEVDLVVLRGTAELGNARGRTLVRAGSHATATSGAEPSLPYAAYSGARDAFDRWVDDQRDARVSATSAAYLPTDMQYYGGTLDRYGSWSYEPQYGSVWYPNVDVAWQPYYDGRWDYVGPFGWTWIGYESWSWPTHHYGRWGSRNSRWFWIPDHRWGPGWVSWASSANYVGWCPLGFDNRPVFGLNISIGGSHHGWNIAHSNGFGHAVPRSAFSRPTLGPLQWSQLTDRPSGPSWNRSSGSARPAAPLGPPRGGARTGPRPNSASATSAAMALQAPLRSNMNRPASPTRDPYADRTWQTSGSSRSTAQPASPSPSEPRAYSRQSTAPSYGAPSESRPTQRLDRVAPAQPAQRQYSQPAPRQDSQPPSRTGRGTSQPAPRQDRQPTSRTGRGESPPSSQPSRQSIRPSPPSGGASPSPSRSAPSSSPSRGSAVRRGGGRG